MYRSYYNLILIISNHFLVLRAYMNLLLIVSLHKFYIHGLRQRGQGACLSPGFSCMILIKY